jgi:16S rRNA (cytosine967-C5)-methyltransferase
LARTTTTRSDADPARRAAIDVVLAVDVDAAYSNLLLPRLLGERKLNTRDAAFATELCYGTLRWQGVLDVVINEAGGRDVTALDPPVRAVLRLGAYQLLHLRTPAHAAVHATVELARTVCGPKPVGLVNAVLRKVGAQDWAEWVRRLGPEDEIGQIAFAHGYPRWVAAGIGAALDAVPAVGSGNELRTALSFDRPVTHLVARPGRVTREELLAQAGPGATAGRWSPYAVHMAGGNPGELPAVRKGDAAVQDEGSQLVAVAAARAGTGARPRTRWLDMCAGPGGKSGLLDALVPHDGRLVAADVQPHRAALVRGSVGARAQVVVADGRLPPWSAGAFDLVLLDAPCTGLGALRRRPEVRWRRVEADLDRLTQLQAQLLGSALESARPGGIVVYATCSPHLRETRAIVSAALAVSPHVQQVDARALLPGVADLGPGPDVQLWPHRHGTDAMYLAALRVDGADDR